MTGSATVLFAWDSDVYVPEYDYSYGMAPIDIAATPDGDLFVGRRDTGDFVGGGGNIFGMSLGSPSYYWSWSEYDPFEGEPSAFTVDSQGRLIVSVPYGFGETETLRIVSPYSGGREFFDLGPPFDDLALVPVPEPGAAALLLVGLALLGRRRS